MQQLALVGCIGTKFLGFLEFVGAIATCGVHAIVEAVRPPYEPREIFNHIHQFWYPCASLILGTGARSTRAQATAV